jgi:molybdate transport system substrate-binding protein
MRSLCTLGVTLLVLSGPGARAAELKVIAGGAFAPAMKELGPQFERATGHTLVVQYGILGALKKQLDGGEAFDLAIVPAALLDGAAKQGKIVEGTRAGLVRVGMAVAVRAGAPKPDIS